MIAEPAGRLIESTHPLSSRLPVAGRSRSWAIVSRRKPARVSRPTDRPLSMGSRWVDKYLHRPMDGAAGTTQVISRKGITWGSSGRTGGAAGLTRRSVWMYLARRNRKLNPGDLDTFDRPSRAHEPARWQHPGRAGTSDRDECHQPARAICMLSDAASATGASNLGNLSAPTLGHFAGWAESGERLDGLQLAHIWRVRKQAGAQLGPLRPTRTASVRADCLRHLCPSTRGPI